MSDLVEQARTLALQIDPCLLGGPDARLLLALASRITALEAELAASKARIAELEEDRSALLQKPIDLAKMDSVDDELNDRMIAYYWYEQAQEARALIKDTQL